MPASDTDALVGGGIVPAHRSPFHTVLRRIHFEAPDQRIPLRPVLVLLALTWVPVMALDLLAPGAPILVPDASLHARFLVAVPLCFAAEVSLSFRIGRALQRFHDSRVVVERDRDRLVRIIEDGARLRDARLVEGGIFALAIVGGQLALWGVTGTAHVEQARSPATIYLATVALPVFQFLFFRAVWRWIVWATVLLRMSRLELRLVPTHPDHAGAIGYLALPTVSIALLVFAASAVIAGTWANEILYQGRPLTSFVPMFVGLVVIAMVAGFGPLIPFIPLLARARLDGIEQYSRLGLDYTRRFHQRWIERDGDREELLGAPDIQSLADLGNAFESLSAMRLTVFGPREMVILFIATLAPMLPLLLTTMSLLELFRRIGGAFLGGLPG